MIGISYRRHRFPPIVIQHAVWLYLRFTLSYRDVEDLLAERGLDISYETVRSWLLKFEPVIARRLRRRRPRPSNLRHLDEVVVRIAGKPLNKLIGDNDTMNAQTLPNVKMPNRDGFTVRFPDAM
jgi:putative transposase